MVQIIKGSERAEFLVALAIFWGGYGIEGVKGNMVTISLVRGRLNCDGKRGKLKIIIFKNKDYLRLDYNYAGSPGDNCHDVRICKKRDNVVCCSLKHNKMTKVVEGRI